MPFHFQDLHVARQADFNTTTQGKFNQCFGGGYHSADSKGWELQPGTQNCWQATFDSPYATYVMRYFEKNGALLDATCCTEKTPGHHGRAMVCITIDDPLPMLKKIRNACQRLGCESFAARYTAHVAKGLPGRA